LVLIRDINMPIAPAPLPYRFQGSGKTIFCRLAFDKSVSLQRLAPVNGEAQQIETESRVPTCASRHPWRARGGRHGHPVAFDDFYGIADRVKALLSQPGLVARQPLRDV